MSDPQLYTDEDLLPLRYLNDLLFCERRMALHLLEQIWRDNQYTTEGTYAHKKVDQTANLKRGDKRHVTGMMLASYKLGVTGRADLVEFRTGDNGISFKIPYPVDFKRGKKRRWDNDEVQLCAQALCLEEILGVDVPAGAIFHIKSQHRREVLFDEGLRQQTIDTAARLHEIVSHRVTPPAQWKARCKGCSLLETCMPKAWRPKATATKYLADLLEAPPQ
ncbi:MAG: CRISPR-associated protein Cas4 [Planctomyces sp.]|nr:CRISPR-associated protein Cas4 [Planctomyces sp.]